jgi:hypothetical protein
MFPVAIMRLVEEGMAPEMEKLAATLSALNDEQRRWFAVKFGPSAIIWADNAAAEARQVRAVATLEEVENALQERWASRSAVSGSDARSLIQDLCRIVGVK